MLRRCGRLPFAAIVVVVAVVRLLLLGTVVILEGAPIGTIGQLDTAALSTPLDLRNGLRKVDVYAPIVDQHVVHLEVGRFAGLFILELDERVLQRIARHLIADHLTADDLAEAAEYDLQIIVRRYRVELAHEQHVLGWRNVRIGDIADDLQNGGPRFRLPLGNHFRNLLLGLAVQIVNLFVGRNPATLQPFGGW
uniref:Putative secreted peptide n=1 Tax=Anopheles braziliensis TaxID=58242 RepID=A0A2M3ZQD8_9DIPT